MLNHHGCQILLVFTGLLCAMFQLPAFATHELDHRFTIHGTVRDGTRFPGVRLPNQTVVVRDAKTNRELQRGLTDADGKFSLLLHVHNSDVGKRVVLQCGGVSQLLELQFEPGDLSTERQVQIDLVVFSPSTPPGVTRSQ